MLSPAEAPAAYAAGLLSGVVDVLGVDAAAVAHEAKARPRPRRGARAPLGPRRRARQRGRAVRPHRHDHRLVVH
nr:hypothetical protein [Angustibacter aerolatus]